jgi:hypothetical protein
MREIIFRMILKGLPRFTSSGARSFDSGGYASAQDLKAYAFAQDEKNGDPITMTGPP